MTSSAINDMATFSDFTSKCVSFPSNWRKDRELTNGETQTGATEVKESEAQSMDMIEIGVQADLFSAVEPLENPDWVAVGQFMKTVEPSVMAAIDQNNRTWAAFERYQRAIGEVGDTALTQTFALRHSSIEEDFAALTVDWNLTGTTVAAGYGSAQHEDWCSHKGAVCTWNIERRRMDPSKADFCLDVDACCTAVRFHPFTPGILAVGSFAGQVIVCNLANAEGNSVIAENAGGEKGHKDAVTCLRWVQATGVEYSLISGGQDGRILVWKLPQRGAELQLLSAFGVNIGSLPRSLRGKVTNVDKESGLTSFAISAKESQLLLAGGETGALFHCSTNAKDPVGQLGQCTVHNPVVLGLRPHNGPVYDIQASNVLRNFFLTAGGDGSVRLYNILKLDPLVNMVLGSGCVYSVACATGDGQIVIFDLMQNDSAPVAKISCDTSGRPVHSVCFNPKRPDILSSGDNKGVVTIWQMGSQLVSSATGGDELQKLEELSARQAANDD